MFSVFISRQLFSSSCLIVMSLLRYLLDTQIIAQGHSTSTLRASHELQYIKTLATTLTMQLCYLYGIM